MDTIVATDTTTEEMEYRHSRISDGVLDLLCEFCTAYFHGMSVKVAPPLDLGEIPRLRSRVHKSTNRRQFLVDDIIHYLSVRRLQKGYCILGVTVVDLYPGPNWNFVLGQACMLKGSGVFSFGRYFNNKSGGHVTGRGDHVTGSGGGDMEWEHDQMKNLWVLMRVMSHELCHLFGMSHCHYFQCAVNESSSVAEAATRQPLTLCPICLKKLRKILKFDLLERYTALWKVTEKLKLIVTGVLESEISTLGEIPSHNTPHSLKGEVTSSESSDGRDTTCGGGNGDTTGNGGMEDTAGNGGVEDTAGNGGVDSTAGNGGIDSNGGMEDTAGNGGVEDTAGNGGVDSTAGNGGIDSNGDTTVNRGMDSSEDIVCSEASLANGHLDHMNRAVDWLGEVIQDLEKYRQTRSREDEGNDGDGNLTSETGGGRGRGRGREAGGDGVNVMSDSEDSEDAEETTALTNHGQTNHRQTRVCCL